MILAYTYILHIVMRIRQISGIFYSMYKLTAILMLTVLLLSISSVTYVKVSAQVNQPPATEPKPKCPPGSSLEVLSGHWHCTPLEYHG